MCVAFGDKKIRASNGDKKMCVILGDQKMCVVFDDKNADPNFERLRRKQKRGQKFGPATTRSRTKRFQV